MNAKISPLPRLPWPLAAVAVLAGVWCQPGEARAHEAPRGWSYPMNCCSNYDCREIAGDRVATVPGGYKIKATGEVIGNTDLRLRDSPDGQTHWCSEGGRDDGKTICLFVPPPAY